MMYNETYGKCWCGKSRNHNGNKALAAEHSKATKARFDTGELTTPPKDKTVVRPDWGYWSNG